MDPSSPSMPKDFMAALHRPQADFDVTSWDIRDKNHTLTYIFRIPGTVPYGSISRFNIVQYGQFQPIDAGETDQERRKRRNNTFAKQPTGYIQEIGSKGQLLQIIRHRVKE